MMNDCTALAPQRRRPPSALADIEKLSLDEIETILGSDEHYAACPTRNYGLRDPLDGTTELLFACRCGAPARARHEVPPPAVLKSLRQPLPSADGRAYFVQCTACGRVGKPSLREWRAVVDWNYESAAAGAPSLDRFPFFNLGGKSPAEAQAYLESIRYDLALRRAQAKKQRELGHDVGRRYLAKIDAYLGWVNVALKMLRQP